MAVIAERVVEITSSNQTSATIVARKVSSSTISAWLVNLALDSWQHNETTGKPLSLIVEGVL